MDAHDYNYCLGVIERVFTEDINMHPFIRIRESPFRLTCKDCILHNTSCKGESRICPVFKSKNS